MLDDSDDIHPLFAGAPGSTEFKKLRKRIVRYTREAIEHYGMIEQGGKWLVCLSGGKDSYTLLAVLHELKWRGLLPVELLACNLDQGQPGFPATVLPEFLDRMQVPHRIEYQDTYSIVVDKVPQGRTFCALCSRLRRGNLYRIAREEGCTAVVLGHVISLLSAHRVMASLLEECSLRTWRVQPMLKKLTSISRKMNELIVELEKAEENPDRFDPEDVMVMEEELSGLRSLVLEEPP